MCARGLGIFNSKMENIQKEGGRGCPGGAKCGRSGSRCNPCFVSLVSADDRFGGTFAITLYTHVAHRWRRVHPDGTWRACARARCHGHRPRGSGKTVGEKRVGTVVDGTRYTSVDARRVRHEYDPPKGTEQQQQEDVMRLSEFRYTAVLVVQLGLLAVDLLFNTFVHRYLAGNAGISVLLFV